MARQRAALHCPMCSAVIEWAGGESCAYCRGCGSQVPTPRITVDGTPAAMAQFVDRLGRQPAAARPPAERRDIRSATIQKDRIDVVVVTALQEELRAVLARASPWSETHLSSGTIVYRTTSENREIAAVCALGIGQLYAATLVQELTSNFEVENLFLVGIAGGIRDDVALGDVVVSDQIIDYEIQKLTPAARDIRWSVYRPDVRLLTLAASNETGNWKSLLQSKRPRARSDEPRLHIGGILSGNKVIADSAEAGALASVWRRPAAVEMEGAGALAALYLGASRVSALVIKGISDRADPKKKDDEWRPYAADAAAAFAWSLIGALARILRRTEQEEQRVTPPPSSPRERVDAQRRELREAISAAFSLEELEVLASDLGVDWDEISDRTKQSRIVGLINYFSRRKRSAELVDALNRERNGIFDAFHSFARR